MEGGVRTAPTLYVSVALLLLAARVQEAVTTFHTSIKSVRQCAVEACISNRSEIAQRNEADKASDKRTCPMPHEC